MLASTWEVTFWSPATRKVALGSLERGRKQKIEREQQKDDKFGNLTKGNVENELNWWHRLLLSSFHHDVFYYTAITVPHSLIGVPAAPQGLQCLYHPRECKEEPHLNVWATHKVTHTWDCVLNWLLDSRRRESRRVLGGKAAVGSGPPCT